MYDKITDENIIMFAIRHYDNPHCESEKEFHDASKRFEVWKANIGFEYDKESLKEVSTHYLNHYV